MPTCETLPGAHNVRRCLTDLAGVGGHTVFSLVPPSSWDPRRRGALNGDALCEAFLCIKDPSSLDGRSPVFRTSSKSLTASYMAP
ncbi:hypothetical protein CCM_04852 [Cordyceps militaris CM01]|uniref:Uncharacterized protein n=1 Tax=Cordyceps militaris (strain CM01) TaxID=983644 RepID=G3JEY5_CORMM|nr:uncharacterized protein CCM_04852 [Cordyceps militaris CM01]EGX93478.1 hypothetical protein CCM_04852 [Cordyceps militaris CM01]